jgi:hypothetical protein
MGHRELESAILSQFELTLKGFDRYWVNLVAMEVDKSQLNNNSKVQQDHSKQSTLSKIRKSVYYLPQMQYNIPFKQMRLQPVQVFINTLVKGIWIGKQILIKTILFNTIGNVSTVI